LQASAPDVPPEIVLAADAEQGRLLFHDHGCTVCHSVGGSGGAKIGSDLARLHRIYSQHELREYILQPPAGVAMPAYAGQMSDDDLEQVVAFVLVAQTFRRNQE
jgi:cytochrome c553